MKTAYLASVFWLGFNSANNVLAEEYFSEPVYPPARYVGDWKTISERFKKLEFVEFGGIGAMADGGSIGFYFKTSDSALLTVLVASGAYWTIKDQKRKRQPIFLLFGGKYFRVPKDDESEAELLAKLDQFTKNPKKKWHSHPKYVERLREKVISRTPLDIDWPSERLDFDDEPGDWSVIRERFDKWEIVELSDWDNLADYSVLFRFVVSDDSEIGVLVAVPRFLAPGTQNPVSDPEDPLSPPDPFSEEERKPEPQKIFLLFQKKLFLVPKGSEVETKLLAMLSRAAKTLKSEGTRHPKYIKRLGDVVNSREMPFLHWPVQWPMTEGEAGGFFDFLEDPENPRIRVRQIMDGLTHMPINPKEIQRQKEWIEELKTIDSVGSELWDYITQRIEDDRLLAIGPALSNLATVPGGLDYKEAVTDLMKDHVKKIDIALSNETQMSKPHSSYAIVVCAITYFQDKEDVVAISPLLESKDSSVVAQATGWMALNGDKRAIEILEKFAQSEGAPRFHKTRALRAIRTIEDRIGRPVGTATPAP